MFYRRLAVRNSAACAAVVFPIAAAVGGLLFFSRLLADVVSESLPPQVLGKLFLLTMLKYAPQLLMLSVFAGVFIAFRGFFLRREMDAWFSAGVGMRHFILPVFLFALPGTLFVAVFSLAGTPWTVHQINHARSLAALDIDVDDLPRGRFVDAPGGVYTYFWDGGDDILIARNDGAHELIFTRRARRLDERNLELLDGRFYRLSPSSPSTAMETMRFDKIRLSLPAAAAVGAPARAKPPTALDWRIPAERAELVWRLSLPLAVMVLALLALLLAQSRPGKWRGYLSALAVFFLYLNLLRYAKGEMAADVLPAFAGFLLPPAAMLGLALLLLRRTRV